MTTTFIPIKKYLQLLLMEKISFIPTNDTQLQLKVDRVQGNNIFGTLYNINNSQDYNFRLKQIMIVEQY